MPTQMPTITMLYIREVENIFADQEISKLKKRL
jgi:hypothetical protein